MLAAKVLGSGTAATQLIGMAPHQLERLAVGSPRKPETPIDIKAERDARDHRRAQAERENAEHMAVAELAMQHARGEQAPAEHDKPAWQVAADERRKQLNAHRKGMEANCETLAQFAKLKLVRRVLLG